MFLTRTILLANSLARPRPATPPCAPTGHARGMSGFWTRQVVFLNEHPSVFRRVLDALESTRKDCSLGAHWKVRGRIGPLAHSSVGEQSCPTPPRQPAVRPVATHPWYVRVLDSTRGALLRDPTGQFPLSNPKPGSDHGRTGSGRPAERPGAVGQDWVPTELFAQKNKVSLNLQGIDSSSLQRRSRSTNKRNPI